MATEKCGTNHRDTKDTKIDRYYISQTYHTKNKRAGELVTTLAIRYLIITTYLIKMIIIYFSMILSNLS